MKILYLIVFIILIISCTEKTKFSSQNKSDSIVNTLIGKWGGLEDTPTFEIKKDSIYFYEQAITYPYKIVDSDMIIYYPESKGILRDIHVFNDTLFFSNEIGVHTKGLRKK